MRKNVVGIVVVLLIVIGVQVVSRLVVLEEGAVDTGDGRSFQLEEIVVDAELRADGVLEVEEQVTYDFDGTFHVGSRSFESGPWEIRDIEAFEGDRQLDEETNIPTLFEWEISPAEGRHTYTLRYEVVNAVIAWPDVVELNWQWVGRDQPFVGHHEVHLRLPGDGEGVRAWAHGPLSGTIEVDDARVDTTVDDLPANTFLETRVIAPRSRFGDDLLPGRIGQDALRDSCDFFLDALYRQNPGITEEEARRLIIDAGVQVCDPEDIDRIETRPQAPRIIAEETELADIANAERREYEREQQRKEDRKRALTIATPFAIALAVLLAFLIWRRWGKEPELAAEVDYWREVPDDPPAVAQALMQWGAVDTDAFSVTVVDLAQRGWIRIKELEKDHQFTDTEKSRDRLNDFERKVMSRLFENGPVTTQKQLTNWAKAHRTDAASWLESFKKAVTKAYEKKGYRAKVGFLPWAIYAMVVVALAVFGIVVWASGAAIAGAIALGAAFLILCNIGAMRRRTPEGAQRHAEWAGLKRYLKDFSQLEDAPSGHLELYERYLVAAVALDVADELVEALRVKIPQVADDPSFATWYVGTRAAGIGSFSGIGDFSSGFSSATASSFRPPPSSSSSSGGGFGGGFSGGGGGGGGGGGFGAR